MSFDDLPPPPPPPPLEQPKTPDPVVESPPSSIEPVQSETPLLSVDRPEAFSNEPLEAAVPLSELLENVPEPGARPGCSWPREGQDNVEPPTLTLPPEYGTSFQPSSRDIESFTSIEYGLDTENRQLYRAFLATENENGSINPITSPDGSFWSTGEVPKSLEEFKNKNAWSDRFTENQNTEGAKWYIASNEAPADLQCLRGPAAPQESTADEYIVPGLGEQVWTPKGTVSTDPTTWTRAPWEK